MKSVTKYSDNTGGTTNAASAITATTELISLDTEGRGDPTGTAGDAAARTPVSGDNAEIARVTRINRAQPPKRS